MRHNIKKVILICLFAKLAYTASISKNSTIHRINITQTTSKETGRTFYGLLGYLTGYRFGQGLGWTSYDADQRETTQLSLIAKLFNGILYLTYGKYPYQYQLTMMPPNSYPPIANIYPMGLQPPIWYPPIIIPQGIGPLNQQQIVNVHEPFNPNEAPLENYQESSVHNSQDILNNVPQPEPEVFEKLDNVTNEVMRKNDEGASCGNTTCVEAVEDDSTSSTEEPSDYDDDLNSADTENNPRTELPEQTTETQNLTTTTKPNDVVTKPNEMSTKPNDLDTKPNSTTASPPISSSTDVPAMKINETTTVAYPYPYYHHHKGNYSLYDHISITENPNTIQKQPDYFDASETYEYHPKYDVIIPYKEIPIQSSFHPMGGNFYENGLAYQDLYEKFNKKQEDSGFKPIESTNII